MTVAANINRWDLQLLPHRADFHTAREGRWEIERLDHMAAHVRAGDTIYDVGAEEGDFTALYRSWVGDTGEVVPIEPSLPYWPAIRQTWEGNGWAPPAHWFAGFASDVTDLEPPLPDRLRNKPDRNGWPGCAYGPVMPDFGFRHLAQQTDTTPQIRLDAFAEETGAYPDIVVMDIEGAEARALPGCKALLGDQAIRHLYVSVHNETMLDWYQTTIEDLIAYMAQYGYEAELLASMHEDFWVWNAP